MQIGCRFSAGSPGFQTRTKWGGPRAGGGQAEGAATQATEDRRRGRVARGSAATGAGAAAGGAASWGMHSGQSRPCMAWARPSACGPSIQRAGPAPEHTDSRLRAWAQGASRPAASTSSQAINVARTSLTCRAGKTMEDEERSQDISAL